MSDNKHSSIIKKLPENHFGNMTTEVINQLLNGQCSVLYGIPGSGVDYLTKQIHYLINKNKPKVNVIFFNLNLETEKIKTLKNEISALIGKKGFNEKNLVEYLQNNKIVIILHDVYSPKYPEFYKFINALRNLNKDNFTILVGGNYTLYKETNKYLQHGCDIFHPLVKIPPFDLEGVKRIIKINNEQLGWNVSPKFARKILFLSGGNAALVKYISKEIESNGPKILEHKTKLAKSQPLNHRLSQIAKLIPKLSIEEQIQLGIVNNNGTLFADLLVEFLKNNEIESLDRLFPDLTKTDRRILTLFIRNQGKIIDKDQLSLILDQTADTYSEWAIYKAVARVRDKIKDRYTIKTLKGRGWRMSN
jgi:hypothetical protein